MLPCQRRNPMQKFLTGSWRASSVLFRPRSSVNCCLIPVYHVRVSEKEVKIHQKEQYFLPKILFVESIFLLWAWLESKWLPRKTVAAKISIHFIAQERNLSNWTEKLETGINWLSLYSNLPQNASIKTSKSNKAAAACHGKHVDFGVKQISVFLSYLTQTITLSLQC